ncbi:MAG: sodium:proton antiporter NhaD [Magnetococcus sp. WYHC-3]
MPRLLPYLLGAIPILLAGADPAWAGAAAGERLPLADSLMGYYALGLFAFAYALVMAEEYTHLRKSKPVIIAAGLIWVLIALAYGEAGMPHVAEQAVRHNLLEYAELFLFLLVAMTYINSMADRQVFEALRSWLVRSGFSYRKLFWLTGLLAFFISPVADNLTTALLMCAVVMAVGRDQPAFVALSCINIVIAANAGGAFSPFGDITTLMVWQKGVLSFWTFFKLFIPSVLNWLVPAWIMSLKVSKESPAASAEVVPILRGGLTIVGLFLLTIITAVSFHNFLHLPPVLGMMLGLGYLKIFAFYLTVNHRHGDQTGTAGQGAEALGTPHARTHVPTREQFDVFQKVSLAEWDTLLFFYGVILCVGGLGTIGYLDIASHVMYEQWGATTANVMVGLLSAVVDNIPVMFAVLSMLPEMSEGQWLLVTMTAGVGGSLLSIGSAAGVALMGQARGIYTFASHLKWTPVIALGYVVSILSHFVINGGSFDIMVHLTR